MFLLHTKSLKSGVCVIVPALSSDWPHCRCSQAPVWSWLPHWPVRAPAICSGDSSVAFYDSVKSLSLVLPFTLIPALIPCWSKSPGSWPLPCFGQKPCGLSLGRVLPFVLFLFFFLSPWPALGAPAGRISQRFHPCTGLRERTEAEKCKEFSQEAKALSDLGATPSSASEKGPDPGD